MARYIDPVPQYFDAAGDPLALGKLYFFVSGTNDPLTTYKDVNETIEHTHPVLLTGDGRVPNIFFSGSAKVMLTDANDVQYWSKDPVTAGGDTGTIGSDWDAISIYQINSVVDFNGELYVSIINDNQNNNPSTTASAWTRFDLLKRWNVNETYGLGDPVIASDGFLYTSTIASNTGDDPIAASGDWTLPSAASTAYTPTAPLTSTNMQGAMDEVAETIDNRNLAINGGFDFWQRGTAFTATGEYTADRWAAFFAGGAVASITRRSFSLGQTDVPGNPKYFLRFDLTSVGSAPNIQTRLEGVETLAGETSTISFWGKCAAGTQNVTFRLVQNFGTGGSPSASVGTDYNTVVLTTAWQRFTTQAAVPSVAGKTLGTDGNDHLVVRLSLPSASTFTIDIANFKYEAGELASKFSRQGASLGDELALCQRFYEKSYSNGTDPSSSTSVGSRHSITPDSIPNGVLINNSYEFSRPKRAQPTMTFYSTSTGASGVARNESLGADFAVAASIVGETGFGLTNNSGVALADQTKYRFHYSADSEL